MSIAFWFSVAGDFTIALPSCSVTEPPAFTTGGSTQELQPLALENWVSTSRSPADTGMPPTNKRGLIETVSIADFKYVAASAIGASATMESKGINN
jgi:hypothetical protein